MKYLYGDSTPSPLQSNFLAYLRDALEFCVHLLLAQERINALRRDHKAVIEHAETERVRIGGLKALVIDAAEGANTDGQDSISMRAVKRVMSAAEQAISTTLAELEAKLSADGAAMAARDREERDGCLESFAKWVSIHGVHEGTWGLSAHLDSSGRYTGEITGSAPFGLAWKCAIELQATHPAANGLKVGDLVTQIELAIPEASGWLKKATKTRPQRIDSYSVDAFSTNANGYHIAIRTTPHAATGLDVEIRDNEVNVTLVGGRETSTVDVGEDDRQRLLTLKDRALDLLTTHASVTRRVVIATLDNAPMADGEDLGAVAKRVIDAAAPIVQQIRNHSLSPSELVIRRLLGNDRREEIFVSTTSLLEKVGRLPRHLRPRFEPLGLEWQRARTPVPGEIYVEPNLYRKDPAAPEAVPEAVPVVVARPAPEEASVPAPAAPSVSVAATSSIEDALAAAMSASSSSSLSASSSSSSSLSASSSSNVIVDSSPAPATTSQPIPIPIPIDASSKETMATTVKRIVGVAREGKTADAYAAYAGLFDDSGFAQQRPQDQRQVVKLMVNSKNPPPASEPVLHAYRRASARLQALIAETNDPADTELLALCAKYLSEH